MLRLCPIGGQRWSAPAHLRGLPGVCPVEPHQQQAFQTYLHAADLVDRRIEALERDLDAAAQGCPWAPLVARLRCLRGVDTLTALGLGRRDRRRLVAIRDG